MQIDVGPVITKRTENQTMSNTNQVLSAASYFTAEQQAALIRELQEGDTPPALVTEKADGPSKFSQDIQKFNTMYRLPYQDSPTFVGVGDPRKRLEAFKKTILDEIKEADEILEALNAEPTEEVKLKVLTMVADWLGDIQVYAASEIRKYGLDNDQVLEIIMRSNFSKQNADGTTTYDAFGKVQKGPNYYKPEPEIEAYIRKARDRATIEASSANVTHPHPLRMSHSRDGRQVTTRVILDVTHDRDLTNVAEFAAQRAYTIDKVTDVFIPPGEPISVLSSKGPVGQSYEAGVARGTPTTAAP